MWQCLEVADRQSDDLPAYPTTAVPKAKVRKSDSQIPKTDKPRPHICTNCNRGFARLEHLKRHERSHTKEKPFECPECKRCFARRDLLLRHQQKLHLAPSQTRGKGGRRESVSGASTTSNRVRKNSMASNVSQHASAVGYGGHRPRANTLGHLDLAALGMLNRTDLVNISEQQPMMHPNVISYGYRGMSNAVGNHGPIHDLPKLDTSAIKLEIGSSLHTAPPYAGSDPLSDAMFASGSTINPAQLHFGGAEESPSSAFAHYPAQGSTAPLDHLGPGDDFTWMQNWSTSHMLAGSEFAVDESSPSGMSSSIGALPPSDMVMDMSGFNYNLSNMPWSTDDTSSHPLLTPTAFHMDVLGQGLPTLDATAASLSPQNIYPSGFQDGPFFNSPLPQNTTLGLDHQPQPMPPAPLSNLDSESPSMTSSHTGSARQSSVTSISTSSITDATRQALLLSLSQPSVFGHNPRKYSQPSIPSPLSPGMPLKSGPNLPSTSDLQRFVNAYIQCFHPHMPFLHVPTMTFDSSDYVTNLRASTSQQPSFGHGGIIGGGGCLILAMAAIGALYEYDHSASRDLFDAAKKMIQLYLEERRKADMSAAVNSTYAHSGNTSQNTPLWLVQAMLLNVIYGHHCGDKQSAEIASTHCAALVSLARAAELAQPAQKSGLSGALTDDGASPSSTSSTQISQSPSHLAWLRWRDAEERKRTLYAVFILSSLLVIAYNHAPAIMNSEILLDLPCDEDLWAAESSSVWQAKGGQQAADSSALSFASALSSMLTANQRTMAGFGSSWYGQEQHRSSVPSEIRPSTFGCLVLINALHNFIWETRSRHHSPQWTTKETEAMFAHIEPALNEWQAAWKANEQHNLRRPNPYGLGPLSADSIPLLDLAFVRLFVNLGRSKEAFWQRDYDTMANEFARGTEVVQPVDAVHAAGASPADDGSSHPHLGDGLRRPSQVLTNGQGSKRERHLRRAAFYAADSLTIAAKYSLTYADAASHELPVQAAMCFFDCSQVLAEWAATVQERVGKYLGVLGREAVDFTQVPAIMLLETEDIDLFTKIDNICMMMEEKLLSHSGAFANDFMSTNGRNGASNAQQQQQPAQASAVEKLPQLRESGYGAKILKATAFMLEKSAVWPGKLLPSDPCLLRNTDPVLVTHVMANALEVQAGTLNQRAEVFVPTPFGS